MAETPTNPAKEIEPIDAPVVFLSHAREDRGFVLHLAEAFELEGIRACGDWLNVDGEAFDTQLEEMQLGADVLVFVLSPESVTSPECQKELDRAIAQKKRILPVLRRESGLEVRHVAPELRSPQWTLLREHDDFSTGIHGLVKAVNTDFALMPEHRRLLQATDTWQKNKRSASYLQRKEGLKSAESWLDQTMRVPDRLPKPTPLQLEYIRQSRASRSRNATVSFLIAAAVAAALGVAAVVAFIQRNNAESAQAEAERQRGVAVARQVAANAELFWINQPQNIDQAALAAIEAAHRLPTLGTDAILRTAANLLVPEKVRLAHNGPVNAAIFSPDGHLIATASADKTARIFDSTGTRLLKRLDHPNNVLNVAFDPTGRLLATAGADAAVRVFDVRTWKEVCHVLAPESVAYGAAFSPDGTRIAAAATYERLIVFDALTGKHTAELFNGGPVFAAGFSGDGRLVATGSSDGSVHVYSLDPPGEVFRFPVRKSAAGWSEVRALAVSPNGRYVAAGGDAGGWMVPLDGSLPAVLRGAGHVTAVSINPDGEVIAAGDDSGDIRLFSRQGREFQRMYNQSQVNSIAWSRDGTKLATASLDGTARLFEYPGGEELLRLPHGNGATTVALSPDGQSMLTASIDGTARIYPIAQRRAMAEWEQREGVSSVAISPDGRFAAAASADGDLRVIALEDGHSVLDNHERARSVAFTPDSGAVVLGNASGQVRALELTGKRTLWELHPGNQYGASGPVLAVAVRKSNDMVAASMSYAAYLIKPGQKEPVAFVPMGGLFPTEESVRAVAFSPDGRFAAIGSSAGGMQVVSTEDGVQQFIQNLRGSVNTIAFGPSSDRVVAGDQAKAVWIFPMPTGEQPRKIDLSAPVYSVDVNRQGTSIAVGSVDQIVILDAATGAIQKRFHQSGSIQAVAFTPDGTALLSAAVKRGRISIHRNPMDAKALADEVCHVLTHNLSPEQWRTLIGPEPRRRTCPNLP